MGLFYAMFGLFLIRLMYQLFFIAYNMLQLFREFT